MSHTTQDFAFWMPTALVRSRQSAAPTSLKEWRIGGIASTQSTDLEKEVVYQDGIDLNYMKSGWGTFNWNHKDGPNNLLGPIDYVEKSDDGLWVEGYLWKHVTKSQEIYDILSSVPENEKSPLGFSIQGKILQRQNGNILKSTVREVAVTHCPINQGTYTDILKAYEGSCRCLSPHSEVCDCEACTAKALDPGTQNPPVAGGNVLRRESLEGGSGRTRKRRKKGPHNQSYEKALVETVGLVLQRRPGLRKDQAERLAERAMLVGS